MADKVFLIHGLFMHGVVMGYLAGQLKRQGYQVEIFSYPSIKCRLADNADRLLYFIEQNRGTARVCHFVGHSLGGLLIRLAYEKKPQDFTGRIVTIGTPHTGSEVARRVATDIHQAVLGGAYSYALDGHLPVWQGDVELGSIAGNRCLGIGMAMPNLEKPNDGTVTVKETCLVKQTDHVQVGLSHTALIYSKRVAQLTHNFLQNGRF